MKKKKKNRMKKKSICDYVVERAVSYYCSYSATAATPTASSSTVYPSSVLPMVPLAPSLNIGPNVCPASLLILATGVSLV